MRTFYALLACGCLPLANAFGSCFFGGKMFLSARSPGRVVVRDMGDMPLPHRSTFQVNPPRSSCVYSLLGSRHGDRSNIPMEIEPIDPLFNPDYHFCGTPGHTSAFGSETRTTSCCCCLGYSPSFSKERSCSVFSGLWAVCTYCLRLGCCGGEGRIVLASHRENRTANNGSGKRKPGRLHSTVNRRRRRR